MSGIQLTPPGPFNFKSPDEWPRWRKRYEQFRVASGLSTDSAAKQVSTLLYCLGEEAESVLMSTSATADDRKDHASIMAKFDAFFKIRRNIIFERARFNRRNQQPGESAEQYIMALYSLAANCEYGALQDEMIRDRLVVGIQDAALSEKLQLDADLTLEKAKKSIRQREAIREQQTILDETNGANVDAMHNSRGRGQRDRRPGDAKHRSNRPKRSEKQQPPSPKRCTCCGKEPHTRSKCPAKDAVCHKCQKKGHYSSMCRSTTVNESTLDDSFLDTVTTPTDEKAWFVEILVGGSKVTFKLDTGAEVTAVSEETYRTLPDAPPLSTPAKILRGPSTKPLQCVGECNILLQHQGKSCNQQLFIVKGLKSNLLGLPAIRALNLVARLAETTTESTTLTTSNIVQRYGKVFQGLGNLGEAYEIQLQPGATPFALFTPRRVPLPLREKVSEELRKMEKMGVISKVDVPTPWCAGMVVAHKKSGAVRICVDLKPLNQSVLREVHPLPKVDETLAQLSGAKVFSKLDANSGFWQIPLAPSSRFLTTFITPFGRYCFNKLPFGISSAPEHFQKRMSTILGGLPGVLCQMDDILVFGRNTAEHNQRVEAVLKRIRDAGVTLNKDKCEFGKSRLSFLGHTIDRDGVHADPAKTST